MESTCSSCRSFFSKCQRSRKVSSDAVLGSQAALKEQRDPVAYRAWLEKWWTRISEWPK